MPRDFTPYVAALDAEARAVTALLDEGVLELTDGETVLARLWFSAPAFQPPGDGVARSFPLRPEEDAPAEGRPSRFVARTRTGEPGFGGGGGAASEGPDLVVEPSVIQRHARVRVIACVYRARGRTRA